MRHRAGTAFDQQSPRNVSFKKRDNFTIPDSITKGDLADDLAGRFQRAVDENLDLYGQLLQAEVPAEDARFIFPNAMQTNLIMTVNLRQLIHMSGLRLCTMAQWEIRQLFKQIRHENFRVSPFFGSFLAPKCLPLGVATRWGTATHRSAVFTTAGGPNNNFGTAGVGGCWLPSSCEPTDTDDFVHLHVYSESDSVHRHCGMARCRPQGVGLGAQK